MTETAHAFTTIIGGLALVAMGGLAVFYYLDKERRARKKEEDEADDRLIKLLQETIKELDQKVKSLEAWKQEREKEMAALRAENQTLIRVLQGRDRDSEDFRRMAAESFKLTAEIHAFTRQTSEGITKLSGILERLYLGPEGPGKVRVPVAVK